MNFSFKDNLICNFLFLFFTLNKSPTSWGNQPSKLFNGATYMTLRKVEKMS